MELVLANRRDLLFASLLALGPAASAASAAAAAPDSTMAITKLPEQIHWEMPSDRPPQSSEQALLWSKPSSNGTRAT